MWNGGGIFFKKHFTIRALTGQHSGTATVGGAGPRQKQPLARGAAGLPERWPRSQPRRPRGTAVWAGVSEIPSHSRDSDAQSRGKPSLDLPGINLKYSGGEKKPILC